MGTAPFSKVFVVKDNAYVYSTEPGKANVEFTWRDTMPVKGQDLLLLRGAASKPNGELVWCHDVITYTRPVG